MKRILRFTGILLLAVTLASCNQTATPQYTATEVLETVEITYAEGDSALSVTENLNLPISSELEKTAIISWESGNVNVIDNFGTVNRQLEDTNVTLIVTVVVGSSSTQKFFDITVLGTIVYHMVTFDVNGELTTSRIVDGQKVTQPENPDLFTYWFFGWYSDLSSETPFDFDTAIIEDLTIYASVELIIYHSVTFDVNGQLTTELIIDGEKISQPDDPNIVAYRFHGWYIDAALEIPFDFDFEITDDVTIYASMESIVIANYTIETYLENLEDEAYSLFSTELMVEEVGMLIELDINRSGFIINDELSMISGIIDSDSTLVLSIYFDRIDYNVTFYDGENELSSQTLKYQELITEIADPVKDNCEFLGWSLEPAGTSYFTFNTEITGNVTLYAQWHFLDTYTYEGYYEGADGLTGTTLESFLRTVVTTGFVGISYGDSRYILDETDRDPNNSSNVILVYLGTSVSGVWDVGITWNREHVWPQSLLGVSVDNSYIGVGSDLQNLKPSNPSENLSRSNKYFDNTTTTVSYAPRDEVKGDIARILFYMTVRYSNLELVSSIPSIYQMALLNRLLEWHLEDPVDSFEQNRNDVIYSYQHNRNPFIDHPEFVEKMWGPITLSDESSVFLIIQTDTYFMMNTNVFDPQEFKRNYVN
ncbi:MAG: InlB B-repeat-containing protein [Bacillota bacterium]